MVLGILQVARKMDMIFHSYMMRCEGQSTEALVLVKVILLCIY